jgi:mRNA-degrading endonuclease RelE of RelBE toxin-antitoxin system
MNWDCRLSDEAVKQLHRLPSERQKQIARAITEMEQDPMRGDVLPLKGKKFRNVYRKRVGRYRIIFALDTTNRVVEIAAILARSGQTYR